MLFPLEAQVGGSHLQDDEHLWRCHASPCLASSRIASRKKYEERSVVYRCLAGVFGCSLGPLGVMPVRKQIKTHIENTPKPMTGTNLIDIWHLSCMARPGLAYYAASPCAAVNAWTWFWFWKCNEVEAPWIPWHAAANSSRTASFSIRIDLWAQKTAQLLPQAELCQEQYSNSCTPLFVGVCRGVRSQHISDVQTTTPPKKKKTPVHVRCCQGHAGEKFQQQPRDASLTCSALLSEISRRLLDGCRWHFLSMPLPLCREVWDAKIDLNCKVQRRQVPSSSEEIGDVCFALTFIGGKKADSQSVPSKRRRKPFFDL